MKRFACVLLTLCAALTLSAQRIHPDYMDGMVYFQLKPDYPLHLSVWDGHDRLVGDEFPFFTEIFRKYEVNSVLRPFHLFGDEGLLRIVELHFNRAQAVDSLVAELQRSEWTVYAEKVSLKHLHAVPNDPYYGVVKGLNWRWHLDMIKADSAWDIQQGSPDIKVAIIDGYVWGDHPDLQIDSANLCTVSYDVVSGYTYTVGSATPPFPQDSSKRSYDISHGTHCAGLAGAISNNGTGIASIGSGLTLMGVAVGTDIDYPLEGIQWAVEHGADVVSMSFGGSYIAETEASFLQVCYNHGIVLVASAGNTGFIYNSKQYPAAYPTVISVTSVDGDGKLSYFSQWGRDRADIAAPGGYISGYDFGGEYPDILSTTYGMSCMMKDSGFSGTFYDGMHGTSMATPIVAGLAGLMLSRDSMLRPDAIRYILQATATPLNPASTHTLDGYGYVNAFKALQKDRYFILSKDTVLFSKDAGQLDSVKVIVSKSWTLSGLPEWLSASAVSGARGVTEVVFTSLSENKDGAERVARLNFVSEENDSAVLVVRQLDKASFLRVDRKECRFAADKTQETLHVYANVPWQINTDANWLDYEIRQSARDTFTVILTTNMDNFFYAASNMLFFTSDYLPEPDTVFVFLESLEDTLEVSDTLLSIGPEKGDSVCLDVHSNLKWKLSGGDSAWILPVQMEGNRSARIVFTAQSANTSGQLRKADYVLKSGIYAVNFTVMQLPADTASVADVRDLDWSLSPNPTSGTVLCRFPKGEATELRVYDTQGRLLKTFAVEGEELLLDFSDFASGMYLMKYGNTVKQWIKK